MKNEDFEPDVVLSVRDEISRHMHIYIDDRESKNCMELRVTWESFVRPVFGELIVQSKRDGHHAVAVLHKPRIGEFIDGHIIVKSVTGQIYVDLDERGKELLGWLRKALQ